MSELLNRFSFEAIKFNNQILFCLVAVWLVLLGCAVHSIFSLPFNKHQRWFWILMVVCLPGVGLLSYLPFALTTERPAAYFKKRWKK
jgi:hypothetical protein